MVKITFNKENTIGINDIVEYLKKNKSIPVLAFESKTGLNDFIFKQIGSFKNIEIKEEQIFIDYNGKDNCSYELMYSNIILNTNSKGTTFSFLIVEKPIN